jgi:D-glycero-alpha-D-manno-heptose-7-phosphate kinase
VVEVSWRCSARGGFPAAVPRWRWWASWIDTGGKMGVMGGVPVPLRVVNAVAPIRICDNGGWTDTWFAGHGEVFNIGVYPYVEVQVQAHPIGVLPGRVVLCAENYGHRYSFEPGILPDRHPLLEAAVDEIGLPDDVSVEISIYSEAPAGCSTGTSAAVTVALIGALDALKEGGLTAEEIAYAAHRIEVERLGIQSGVQDQLCAAYGGINYIEVSYPHARVSPLTVGDAVWWELERRLVLLFLGRVHVSSEVHDGVIASLERGAGRSPHLEELRCAARDARDAVCAGDLRALGRAMITNTDAQRRLHTGLVSSQAQTVIDVAAAHGAWGWKVNGAGGEGGSLTLLCGPDMRRKRQMIRALRATDPSFQVIPTYLSRHGLRVWET